MRKMINQQKSLRPGEKQEALFQSWLSPKNAQGKDIKFQSPKAEKEYKERVIRFKDTIQLKKTPGRVPISLAAGFFPVHYAGITVQESMNDYDRCYQASKKFPVDTHGQARGTL
jgi:hypothetical protein